MNRLIEKVKVHKVKTGDRTQNNPGNPPTQTELFREFVGLPTYSMVGEVVNGKVDILVPDDEVEEIGNSGKFRLVKDKIRKKYPGQKWDNDDPLDI